MAKLYTFFDTATNTFGADTGPTGGGGGATITRDASTPTGGADGDVHFHENATTGSVDVYHKKAGTWTYIGQLVP
jgi:hypothetical protein